MKNKLLIVGGVALAAAVVTTGIFYSLLSDRIGDQAEREGRPVVVAAADLPRGTELTADNVQLQTTTEQVPDGAFDSVDALIGKYVVQSVSSGRAVTQRALALPGVNGLAAAVPQGMRAVTLFVDEYAGVYDIVRAGDRIDVMAAQGTKNRGTRYADVETVLENIEVLATDREKSGRDRRVTPNVTVLVDEEDVEAISLADQGAVIRIALRNPTDGAQVSASAPAEQAANRPAPARQ